MRKLTFLLFALVFRPIEAAEIKDVRMWAAPERTRVVFDLTEAVDYQVFTIRNPDRVVIDFKQTRSPSGLRLPIKNTARLKRLRYARRGETGLRVVLDLKKPVNVRDSLLAPNQQYGYRVVLDLLPGDGEVGEPVKPKPAAKLKRKHAPPRSEPARDVIIAIDAGHGGDDVGAIGPSGIYEKDIVLALARELAARIDREVGMRAVLTRSGDYYLKLRTRMDKARAARADLFISIHADAFRDPRVRGSSIYVLSQSGASSEAAKWLADNENAADLIGGVTLDDKDDVLKSVLLDLSQTASIEASIDAANDVLESLKRLGKVHKKRVQHAGFVVLKSPDIPSLLIETAYISNPSEERRLRSGAYRQRLAGAIFEGIVDYFEENAPPFSRLAQNRNHKVARGETLSGIAVKYDVSISRIKLANNLNSETLWAGRVLKIP
ncbi:MAG: N-acetylmuramoyl-L-alanine amidase [Gammaproteobacteria bacterium]|nr:N-acetylmuramoyl-L-alanine amidase [Gammaproteobacteria bacterium]